jgi:adenine-specific DNA methylase
LDYPKRLIEVDLPIKRISAHARREKSIRHGHISTLHIWWARRPLAACRAVICAALWPDPADEKCPPAFRAEARRLMTEWAKDHLDLTSPESMSRFNRIKNDPEVLADNVELRKSLFDFIADFTSLANCVTKAYIDTSHLLTSAAHRSLSPESTGLPLVVDPFAGGGAIPLEALRVGADAFASDLNPVPVLLNRIVLSLIPQYGRRLADEVRDKAKWMGNEAIRELAECYPTDPDGATPIAYLWARTIQCEGPHCAATVPLIRSMWLAKRDENAVALQFTRANKLDRLTCQIITRTRGQWTDHSGKPVKTPSFEGTVKRGSATCLCCGYTTPNSQVRKQLTKKRGGANDAMLLCVVSTRSTAQGRFYRAPTQSDIDAIAKTTTRLSELLAAHTGSMSLIPDEPTPLGGGRGAGRAFSQRNYGMNDFADLFSSRQALAIATFSQLLWRACDEVRQREGTAFGNAVQAVLACAVDREAEHQTTLCRWNSTGQKMQATFGRQALPIVFDYCEASPIGNSVGGWGNISECVLLPFETAIAIRHPGVVEQAPAQSHPLPDDSAAAFISDPPYYDAVPYSDLSDFFYVWLKRNVPGMENGSPLTPKGEECIVDEVKGKDAAYFENTMALAMAEGRRVLAPYGIGVVVFAHKSTAGWESQLQAMIDAGWTVTASWPIDTEMGTRLRAMNSAALGSSIHLICRPRENNNGIVRATDIGDWRAVLTELPNRIHEWMPRLAEEGVVGADAIFACIGPALEIFSRYSRVEKASGEVVALREYLEQVWAAVSTEALSMIFRDADAAGLESDARFTAIVLWTLGTGAASGSGSDAEDDDDSDEEDDEDAPKGKAAKGGFALEYDAARKIAQGLGVNLEQIDSVVEVKGDKARLLPVSERAAALFGKAEKAEAAAAKKRGKKVSQKKLFDTGEKESVGGGIKAGIPDGTGATPGATVLDRIHQSMLLFAGGRADALKRFIVEEGVGGDARFWKLAQSLSALYPAGSEEKRWVDGVLARKKSFGF